MSTNTNLLERARGRARSWLPQVQAGYQRQRRELQTRTKVLPALAGVHMSVSRLLAHRASQVRVLRPRITRVGVEHRVVIRGRRRGGRMCRTSRGCRRRLRCGCGCGSERGARCWRRSRERSGSPRGAVRGMWRWRRSRERSGSPRGAVRRMWRWCARWRLGQPRSGAHHRGERVRPDGVPRGTGSGSDFIPRFAQVDQLASAVVASQSRRLRLPRHVPARKSVQWQGFSAIPTTVAAATAKHRALRNTVDAVGGRKALRQAPPARR